MSIIIIDGLAIRLASGLQNVFNPSYAFGGIKQGGSLALRETESGHLLLPYDAEGNVIVTPGGHYELVFVAERNSGNGHTSSSSTARQRSAPPSRQPREELPVEAAAARDTHNGSKLPQKMRVEGYEAATSLGAQAVVAARDAKKRSRSLKSQPKMTAENDAAASRHETGDKKDVQNGKDSAQDTVTHRASGNGASVATSLVDASAVATRKSSSLVAVGNSPKTRVNTRPPSSSSSDSDDVPLTKVYTRQRGAPVSTTIPPPAAVAPERIAKRQAQHLPTVTPSTSDSD